MHLINCVQIHRTARDKLAKKNISAKAVYNGKVYMRYDNSGKSRLTDVIISHCWTTYIPARDSQQ